MLNEFQGRKTRSTCIPNNPTSSSGETSKNLVELRKRLLSRSNRIYAVPDESPNGSGEKLHLLTTLLPPPATTAGSSGSVAGGGFKSRETFSFSASNHSKGFADPSPNFQREIIAPNSPLDLSPQDGWPSWNSGCGTVKRRPPLAQFPISTTRNESQSAKPKPTATVVPAPSKYRKIPSFTHNQQIPPKKLVEMGNSLMGKFEPSQSKILSTKSSNKFSRVHSRIKNLRGGVINNGEDIQDDLPRARDDKDANQSLKTFPIHPPSSLQQVEKTLKISHSQIECDKSGDSRRQWGGGGLEAEPNPASRVRQRLDSQGGNKEEDDEREPEETFEELQLEPKTRAQEDDDDDEPFTNERMQTLKDLCSGSNSNTLRKKMTTGSPLSLMSLCQEDISCFPISNSPQVPPRAPLLNEQLDPSSFIPKTNEIRTGDHGDLCITTGCGHSSSWTETRAKSPQDTNYQRTDTNSPNQNQITPTTTTVHDSTSSGHHPQQCFSAQVVKPNVSNGTTCLSPILGPFFLLSGIESNISFLKIYTDWANHYLEKARCKRHIQDLQVDVTDGVLLADVVEAVTNQKVSDVTRKPKNASQMLDNVQSCLVFLSSLGVSLEGITARDIRDGHLKSILSLFFQLSRYKQQQKQQERDRHNLLRQSAEMHSVGLKSTMTTQLRQPQDSSKLPSPFGKHGGGNTSIPIPSSGTGTIGGSSTLNKKMSGDKHQGKSGGPPVSSANGPPHLYQCGGSVKPTSGNSSRSTSPSGGTGIPQSFIPTTRTSIPPAPSSARSSLHEKHINNAKSSSIGQPTSKSSVRVHNNNSVNASTHLIPGGQQQVVINGKGTNNTSMLEKFKFFKDKDKGDKLKNSTGSKRTSSSSGFSSARSERSDSSVSLCGDSKSGLVEGSSSSSLSVSTTTTTTANWTHPHQSSSVSPLGESSSVSVTAPTQSAASTPRQGIKGFRQRLGKVIASKESKSGNSPKSSRKEAAASFAAKSGGTGQQSGKQQLRGPGQTPRVNMMMDSIVGPVPVGLETNGNSGTSNGPQSFLRHPRPPSANRDSRNRFSGTGIPSRNSLTSPSSTSSSSTGNNNPPTSATATTVPDENVSSMNLANNSSVGTGIPKPTAAVKGTTKPIITPQPQPKDDLAKSAGDSCGKKNSGGGGSPPAKSSSSATATGVDNNEKNNEGISVALVSPMPPLLHNGHVLTSLSSLDSTLSQSNSNSSDTSVIFMNGHEQQSQSAGKSSSLVKDNNSQQEVVAISSDANKAESTGGSGSATLDESSSKVSKMCERDGNSLTKGNENNCEHPLPPPPPPHRSGRGINGVIVECDEDELMLNVTPMEPLEPTVGNSPYGYMKSPPGSGYMSPKSSGSNFVQMNHHHRLGPGLHSENSNNGGGRVLLGSVTNRQVFSSPYGDPARLLNGHKQSHPQTKYNSSHYSAASMGDYDYMDLDNLDISGGGYLSDGDLLLSGTNGNRPNDGYLSESGTSIYSRNRASGYTGRNGATKENSGSGRNNKHALTTEDRSYIFDLNTNGPDLLRFSSNNSNVDGEGTKNKNSRNHVVGLDGGDQAVKKKVPPNLLVSRNKGISRFDDSSSLSSGISDLNEIPTDLTSSSVNSELSSPYASLQRTGEESSRKKREPIDPQSIIYRVVGCRSGNSRRQVENGGDIEVRTSSSPKGSQSGSSRDCNGFNGHRTIPSTILGHSSSSSKNSAEPQQPPMNSSMSNGFQSSGSSSGRGHGQSHKMDGKSTSAMVHMEESSGGGRKRGVMGMKDEHYTREMAERLIREEREHRENKDRQRAAAASSSHHGHNGHGQNNGGSSGSSDGSGSKRSGKSSSSVPVTFGYVRRSTGSGGGSNGNVSMTKYTLPVDGKMQLGEDYKMAHHASITLMPKTGDYYSPSSANAVGSPKPRTKVKVSGGTQTTNDLAEMGTSQRHHPMHHNSAGDVVTENYAGSTGGSTRHSGSYPSPTQSQSSAPFKSLSLTTPTATQLSQSLRERILGSQSLPKGATGSADYAAILATIQQQQQHQHYLAQQHHQVYGTPNTSKDRMSRYNKMMMNDGSLSDTGGYSNYADIQAYAGQHLNSGGVGPGTYSWMRHSAGYASSITSAPTRLIGGGGSMTEAESLESLSSTSSLAAQLRDVRSNSLTQGRINPTHQRDTSPSRSPRLNRSNSISHFRERTFPRSTKSEKLYPSMLQRTDDVNPYYSTPINGGTNNMPPSPSHSTSNRFGSGGQGPYLSTHPNNHSVRLSMSPYSGFLAKIATKEDEINGSSLSLVSTASSIYSSQEEKQAYEIRKLSRELGDALEKVQTLTNQLSTNAHVVAAFEQSLSNMTQRLQALTATAEQKDSELLELRQTIEYLRKQSIEAGLTVTNLTSGASRDGSPIARQLSADSVSSINSISSACSGTSHSHTSSPSGQVHMTPLGTPTHNGQIPPDSPNSKKKHSKNKGWLRSSFTKAFSRSKTKSRNGSLNDQNYEDSLRRPSNLNGDHTFGQNGHGLGGHYGQQSLKRLENSAPASPLLASPHGGHSSGHSNGCGSSSGSHSPHSNENVKGSSSSSAICDEVDLKNKSVDDMKKQLREKEMVLTDIRLEALTSAHQLESLKETVTKMRNEMQSLKQDNERLQRLVTCKSLTSSQTSLQTSGLESLDRRLSTTEMQAPSSIDILLADPSEKEGKRIIVTVFLGCHGSYERYINTTEGFPAAECAVGTVAVSSRTKWDLLDSLVRRAFKDYVMRVDPISNLGLSADSIVSYNVGEVFRSKESQLPELLPCGYLVGDVNKIRICLKGALHNGSVDALAFETLIPKSIIQRYVTWLTDHGRMILCGPSGTGKSYLARKLGEFFVARSGKDPSPEAIATFSADHKNNKELRQYLSNFAEQCESSVDLPSVIILDNLHQVSSFGEVFNGFLHSRQSSSPLFIGTMSQSTGSTANLQLHHNFRWVLFGNNVEPVKGLLSRFLRRRVIEVDVQGGAKNVELTRVFEWLPEVWLHINRFLERHNSADVSIGPRLFLSCPTDVGNSQVWFTDLWNYSIVPYMIEAIKEGLQLYGKKVPWEDPTHFLIQTYPWVESQSLSTTKLSLQRLRPEDVGYEKSGPPAPASKVNKNGTDHDPLMNMLMRLQEAANYSGPQSNDSDTTSLDSHTSLDSKDFIATA